MSLRENAIASMRDAMGRFERDEQPAAALDGLLYSDLGDELCACPLALVYKAHKVKIHLLAQRLALGVGEGL